MAECPSCGENFARLGLHWWHGSCPYPSIDAEIEDIFIGLLMGDGSIPDQSDGNNSIFHVPMINRRFLRWLDNRLGILTTGVRLKKTAAELADNNRRTGFSPNADETSYHDMYTVWSRTHPFFDRLRSDWYTANGKQVPESLTLTPVRTKYWYISDGYLELGKGGRRARAGIKAHSERTRSRFITSLFNEIGLDPTFTQAEIRFSCDETEHLLNWMGEPPTGFEYKWEIASRERYLDSKERAYETYTTQSLDGTNSDYAG